MQATMTVRTDAALKKTFSDLCQEFGMSANTAMNVFMRAVAETRSIPFQIGFTTGKIRFAFGEALQNAHQEAIRRNRPELSMEEIDAEIAAARAERYAKRERARA